jgi:hypothetical protein
VVAAWRGAGARRPPAGSECHSQARVASVPPGAGRPRSVRRLWGTGRWPAPEAVVSEGRQPSARRGRCRPVQVRGSQESPQEARASAWAAAPAGSMPESGRWPVGPPLGADARAPLVARWAGRIPRQAWPADMRCWTWPWAGGVRAAHGSGRKGRSHRAGSGAWACRRRVRPQALPGPRGSASLGCSGASALGRRPVSRDPRRAALHRGPRRRPATGETAAAGSPPPARPHRRR